MHETDIDRLRIVAGHIYRLTEKPQPGLMTWNEMMRQAVVEMQRTLCDLGATPEATGVLAEQALKRASK